MLPARHRLRRRADFRAAARGGRRAGRHLLVVHVYRSDTILPPKVGFVVGRSVGSAVVRNTVRRRLRHIIKERLGNVPTGAVVIVRALPMSASASSAELGAELDALLERLVKVENGRPMGGKAVSR